jgi:hypothetical protein
MVLDLKFQVYLKTHNATVSLYPYIISSTPMQEETTFEHYLTITTLNSTTQFLTKISTNKK